ncbi:ABC transporter ATP-binding protein [Halobacillus massiliensis]|uniref:ABC transporter ATP-binding protein n=1 Tax=Halobacillus massiliensis TaxID=1926286 RepID=UPI0009E347CD|nr:ABC transporter ATP-binding protein [Halobacillus massiliensis]
MLKVEGLTKKFNKQTAVNNISFTLAPETCTALLGPNGAGKTTSLRMIAGLMHQTSGNIKLTHNLSKDIRREIGYLPQHPQFHSWMTGREFLVYVGRLAFLTKKEAETAADQLLERVGLIDAGRKRIGKYSGGMKQRLGIAQAMIHKPKLLMLDEPVSALDPIGRRDVLNLMEELKKETTLLFSTHILNDAEEASDHLLLMNHGNIIESGSFADVRQRHAIKKIVAAFDTNSSVSLQDLQILPHVVNVEKHKQEFHIYVEDMQLGRQTLMKYFSDHDLPVQSFEAGSMSLEELFMKVVNQDAMADHI